ncbi:MAG: L-seryl-tRNA(Sec) selenium transferase [Deferribacterales bacterium]
MDKNLILRNLPKIDKIIEEPLFDGYDRSLLKEAARHAVEQARETALKNEKMPDYQKILSLTDRLYTSLADGSLKKVINATGIPIHTNLGRSPLPRFCMDEVTELVCGYSNLEYDTDKGKRGDRYHHAVTYLKMLTGAEDAVIVNNNASAVFLILNTLSNRKEAVVSRGELVEIGGSFRVPDVMRQSGAKMVEIGTTNKTRISDYTDAVTPKTALLMKVHKSNYEIIGFSEEAELKDIADAAREAGLVSYYDAGSGLIEKLLPDNVCSDKTLLTLVKSGVDLVSFSGDKMTGACQAGIIVGRKDLIAKIKKNPLMRMLRVDKITLAVLQSILRSYITGRSGEIPVNAMMSAPLHTLKEKADNLADVLKDVCEAKVIPVSSSIGGGSCPLAKMRSCAVKISIDGLSPTALEKRLRNFRTPVIARISEYVYLDVRTLDESEYDIIKQAVKSAV